MPERVERVANYFDDLRSCLFIGFGKCDADGAEAGDEASELRFGHCAFLVERPNFDIAPTAPCEDVAGPIRVGETELPRFVFLS